MTDSSQEDFPDPDSTRTVDDLFEELVREMEKDAPCDVDGFLRRHPGHAAEIQARLEKLKELGLSPGEIQPEAPDLLDTPGLTSLLSEAAGEPAERYELLESIADGGMGTVYRARDRHLDRTVALKAARLQGHPGQTPSKLLNRLRRFLDEARVTGSLSHPNIVPIHDIGVLPNRRPFFVMKFIEGMTWTEQLRTRSGRDRIRSGVEVLQGVCDAVAYAHSRGVIHRDLKPDNIMVGPFGEVLVVDWGLVKILEGLESSGLVEEASLPDSGGLPSGRTTSGSIFGTPAFMSPEQAQGKVEELDVHTDIFGIGALLYFLLQGEAPYRGERRSEVLEAASRGGAHPLTVSGHRELVAICRKAMSTRAEDRYSSVKDLAADLRAALQGLPGQAWKETLPSRLSKFLLRHPSVSIGLAAGGLIGLLGWGLWNQGLALDAQRKLSEQAQLEADRDRDFAAFERWVVVPATNEIRDVHDMLREMVEALRLVEIELSSEQDVSTVMDQLADLRSRSPRLADRVVNELVGLYDLMKAQHVQYAWESLNDSLPERLSQGGREFAASVASQSPDLAALWPLVAGLEVALLPGPWQVEFRSGREQWREHFLDPLPGLLASEHYPHGEAIDLFRLGNLASSVWERHQRKGAPEEDVTRAEDACLDALFAAAEASPGHYWIHETLPNELLRSSREDRMELAMKHAELALATAPFSARAHGQLGGLLLLAEEDLPRAVRLLKSAIRLGQDTMDHRVNLGRAFLRAGHFEEAVAELEHCLGIQPSRAELWEDLATALEGAGRDSEAREARAEAAHLREPK